MKVIIFSYNNALYNGSSFPANYCIFDIIYRMEASPSCYKARLTFREITVIPSNMLEPYS